MVDLKRKARSYSQAFGNAIAPLADPTHRRHKAAKINAVLEKEGKSSDNALMYLDIGCSFGIILDALAQGNSFGVGIDIDQYLLGTNSNRTAFALTDAENLPFPPGIFDVVICNHVYEHTDNPEFMMSEINRVLKTDGVCYFAGPNKYEPIEPHYGLPFLSWLPTRLADLYMKLAGEGNQYAERPFSIRRIQKLLQDFEITDYTEIVVTNPVDYCATDVLQPNSLKQTAAKALIRTMPFFFPGFIYILRKPR